MANKPADNLDNAAPGTGSRCRRSPYCWKTAIPIIFADQLRGLGSKCPQPGGRAIGLSAATLPGQFRRPGALHRRRRQRRTNGEVHETAYLRSGVSRCPDEPRGTDSRGGPDTGWFNRRGITSLLEAACYPSSPRFTTSWRRMARSLCG